MKEQDYEPNKTTVKVTREDLVQISNGKIIRGFRVDVGLEE